MRNIYLLFIALIFIVMPLGKANLYAQDQPVAPVDPNWKENLDQSPEDRQVALMLKKAENYYTQSLETLDEDDILRSIETLEELLETYPDSIGSQGAYFILGELLTSKIQSDDAYKGAVKVYEDYLARFPWTERAWEALYNKASVQYIYLKDYTAAAESINSLLNDYSSVLLRNDDDMKKTKLLYAKIMHKNGEIGKEVQALDEVELIDPNMDFSYQAELIKGLKPERILPADKKGDRFIFMGKFDPDFPVKRLVDKFDKAEQDVKKLIPGIERTFPLEIFVYQDSEFFSQTTDRLGSFGTGADAQIFYLSEQPIEPLFAQVYSFLLNSQPSDVRVEFLDIGFMNAFGNISGTQDTAALELGISFETFKGDILLDNNQFPLLSERAAVAGAYVNYLLSNYPPESFYRAFRLLEGSRANDIKIAGSEDTEYKVEMANVSPQILLQGFENAYGVTFEKTATDFLQLMTQRREQLDRSLDTFWAANKPSDFKVDQSSPEQTLVSYFKAIQLGRYEDLRQCTTGDLREVLDEAYKIYKDKKILDKIERWKMAIPYIDVRIEVVGKEVIGADMVVFAVNLLKNEQVLEKKNLVIAKDKNKWYVSEN